MEDLKRRDFLKLAAGGCLATMLSGLTRAVQAGAATGRPNILLIMTDDMGFSDIGCYGGEIPTPNIDKLAAGGLRFTQFYNTARCCPTRASLLTGLYPHQAAIGGMTDVYRPAPDGYVGDLSRNTATIAEVLKPAGYATYMAGKWHVTTFIRKDTPELRHNWPLQRGFDRYYGILGAQADYFKPNTLVRDNAPIWADKDPEYTPEQYYLTDAITDHAVKYLNEHMEKKADQPFFMYVAYTAAHFPLHAPENEIAKFKGKYDGGYEPIRKARYARERQMKLIHQDWDLSPQFGKWEDVKNKDWEARCMEVFAAQVHRMDTGVGKILDVLEKSGQMDNTLILFLHDNGGNAEKVGREAPGGIEPPLPGPTGTTITYGEAWANVSNTPFRYYKHFVHEGGISTPLIAHWPSRITRRGEIEEQPGHLIDIMATFVDVSGAEYPGRIGDRTIQPMEGCSLVPAFAGRPVVRKNSLFWEHEGNRAIREGCWKLVARGRYGAWELYDMEKDRTELHDLAAAMPDKVKTMAADWDAFAHRTHVIPWPGRVMAYGPQGAK
ncbi:MAG: arylsulfatase [bacterium]|nr:arylsulfatase [bacterium]